MFRSRNAPLSRFSNISFSEKLSFQIRNELISLRVDRLMDNLRDASEALVKEAKALKADVESLTDTYGQRLDGCQKLSRKIDAEIKFISQVKRQSPF